jgi:outer membrane biosynthesis protein TonB
MRLVTTRVLVAFTLFEGLACVACGGGTPPPKDSDEAVASSAPKATGKDQGSDVGGSSEAPAASASAAPSPAPSPAAASSDTSAPAGDDPWMAAHQISPKDVLHTAGRAQGKVQACFRAGKKRDPSVSGEVKIRFVITNDGDVRVWKDDMSSMSDAEVTKCVGEVIKTLKFPKQKSPGDAWGSYTIH